MALPEDCLEINFWRFYAQEELSMINNLVEKLLMEYCQKGISALSAAFQGLPRVPSQTQAIGYCAYKG